MGLVISVVWFVIYRLTDHMHLNTAVGVVVSNQWTGLLDWTTGLTILPQKSIFRQPSTYPSY